MSHLEAPGADGTSRRLGGLALAVVLAASFVVVLDFSIVNLALASIARELDFSSASLQWVITAYATTFGGLLILGGALSDRIGRRRTFVAGLLLFTLASAAGGLAQSGAILVVARAVQGVGAALVAPAGLALITTGYREGPERNRALGLYGATASLGFVGGLLLGGVLVQWLGWRSVFFVNVPVGLVAAAISLRRLPPGGQESRRGALDVVGALLITVAVAALVYAVSEGQAAGFAAPDVLLALTLSALALAGFVHQERHHPRPLVRFSLLRIPTLRTGNLVTLLVGAWNGGEMIVMSLLLQQSLHYSPIATGLLMAPQGAAGLVTGLQGARLTRWLGLR
ncbi:MAG: MFS transporter, partial [Candidatus Dormiibacterota bacterium]